MRRQPSTINKCTPQPAQQPITELFIQQSETGQNPVGLTSGRRATKLFNHLHLYLQSFDRELIHLVFSRDHTKSLGEDRKIIYHYSMTYDSN